MCEFCGDAGVCVVCGFNHDAKRFRVQDQIGNARHVVSYHDGKKTHADGSKFFDMVICGSKKKLAAVVGSLKTQGYVETL